MAHLIAARRAGEREQVTLALRILAFTNHQRVWSWVALKVPRKDVDDVAAQVLESAIGAAIRSPFEGEEVGQFRAWLHKIAKFRIADYHRGQERTINADPLPEGEGGDAYLGPEPSVPDAMDELFSRGVIDRALGELTDTHRRCIELGGPSMIGFEGVGAKETAASINDQLQLSDDDSMTDVNVHKILSRFRARCRELYEEGGRDG